MSNNKIEINELNTPISNYAKWISIIGVIGTLLFMGSSMGLDDPSAIHYGKMKSIQMLVVHIPLWVSYLLYYVPYVLFFAVLYKSLKEFEKPSSELLLSYVIIVIVICLLSIIESDDIYFLLLIFVLTGGVLEIIIAVSLIKNYNGRLKNIAIIMLASLAVSQLWVIDIDDTWFVDAIAIIEFFLDYYLFSQFAKLFAGEETVL